MCVRASAGYSLAGSKNCGEVFAVFLQEIPARTRGQVNAGSALLKGNAQPGRDAAWRRDRGAGEQAVKIENVHAAGQVFTLHLKFD